MEWHRIRSKSLQMSLQLLALIAITLCGMDFVAEPTDQRVLEGNDVTIYCVVRDLVPSIHEVYWNRGGIQISHGGTLDMPDPRLSIEMDASRGRYNLMISAVTLSDDALYYCEVKASGSQVLMSEIVRLEVHHIPPEKYPSCFPLTKDSYKVGEEVTITCQSTRGNPPVTLLWISEGQILPIHTDDTQNERNIDYTFTVTRENNGDLFQCKLTTQAMESVRRSCALGPLSVIYSPVNVVINVPDIIADQEIELTCISEANPPPLYTWTFGENFDQTRITYSDDNQRIIFKASLSDNGQIIGCNATNDLGTEGQVVALKVNPVITDPVYSTSPSRDVTADDGSGDNGGAPSKPQTDSSNNIILKPEVLAIIASTLTLILLVLIVLVIVTCRCRQQNPKTVAQMPQMIYGQYGPSSVQNWEQGSIYFEPRDRISVRDMPTWQRPAPWHRNVAVQVPWVEEPPYEEIGRNWDEGMTLEI